MGRRGARPALRLIALLSVMAFALGWVELVNHSDQPNCRCEVDYEAEVLRIFTIVDIPRGTELCHNYGIDPWFKVAD